MTFKGCRKGRTAFHIHPDLGEGLFELSIRLLGGQRLQALHQGESGVDHGGKLTGKNGQVLLLYPPAESGNLELDRLRLGLNGNRKDPLLTEPRDHSLRGIGLHPPGNHPACPTSSAIDKDRHVSLPLPPKPYTLFFCARWII